MNNLDGYTRQSRGQGLNGLIAEMLQCWGVDAEANTRTPGAGEIDVDFELGGKHFAAEAKWETDRTGTGPIAILQKRLRQRLDGTIGILVSMAGYTAEAIGDLKQGEPLKMLLLERGHLEAMLAGFSSPEELLTTLVRRASRRGTTHVGLTELLAPIYTGEMTPKFEPPPETEPLVLESSPGFEADVVLSNLPFGQAGIAEVEPGVVLLTLSEGVFRVDFGRRTTKKFLPIANCSRSPLVRGDGSVFVVRQAGVARIDPRGHLKVVAGGRLWNGGLSLGPNGTVWAFDCGFPLMFAEDHQPLAVRLGDQLGDQIESPIDYPSGTARVFTRIDNDTFLVCGNGISLISPTSKREIVSPRDSPSPGAVLRVGDDRFLLVCNQVEFWELTLSRNEPRKIAKLKLNGHANELTPCQEGGGYLFCYYVKQPGEHRGAVVRWKYP